MDDTRETALRQEIMANGFCVLCVKHCHGFQLLVSRNHPLIYLIICVTCVILPRSPTAVQLKVTAVGMQVDKHTSVH